MNQCRKPRRLTIWPVLFPLLLVAGCSRPAELHGDGATPSDQHQVPFHDDGSATSNSGATVSSETSDNRLNPETNLPFRDPQSLPAGTLLTVRLRNPISADNPGGSGTFEAVVDEPVVIEGKALVPRGANVAGRVESARASMVKRDHSYVRLTLDSIDVAGKDLHVQTSSLFARGVAPDGVASPSVITLEKGRRLTFRLVEPVYVASQQALSGH